MAIQMFDLGPGKLDFSPLSSLGSNFVKSYEGSRKARRDEAEEDFWNKYSESLMSGAPSGTSPLASVSSKAVAAGSPGPASLIQNESGGNWAATNDAVGSGGKVGHFGRLQFGQARIQDAANAGAIPQGTTPAQFTGSPELQKKAENWHFGDIDNFIQANGYDKLIGQNINGVPITVDGMRAVAHLGGTGGLRKFVETQGSYDPSDRNGTRLSDYFSRHGGNSTPLAPRTQIADPVALQRQPVQVAQAGAAADLPPQGSDAAPTQGFAIPGSGTSALPAAPDNAPTAAQRQTIALLLRNKDTRAAGIQMMTQLQKQRSFSAPFEYQGGTFQMGSDGEIKQVIAPRNPLDDEGKRADIDLKRKQAGEKKLATFTSPDGTTYSFDPATGEAKPVAQGQKPKVLQSVKGEDGTLYSFDPETGATTPQVKGGPKSEDVSGLRKEIQQLPSYKNMAQAAPIYKSMLETAGRNSKASDLNMVYGLGKIMDPGSVVREGEMIMVKNSAGLSEQLLGAINSLNGGAALTPETRQAIMREAYGRMQGYKQLFDQDTSQYDGIIQRRGMNRADVLPDFGTFDQFEQAKPQKGAKTEAPAAPGPSPSPQNVRPDGSSPPMPRAGAVTVPPQAARALVADPSLAAQFDAKYGAGTAKRVLGK